MANFIIGIISLTIGVVVLANVFLTTVKGINTNGTAMPVGCTVGVNCTYPYAWSAAEIALWGLLSIAAIAGIVYGVLNVFGLA